MSNQVMDFYNNDSNRPFEMSFGQTGKTVGTMRFNGDVMTFEGEADAAATVFIDMIVKKQSQQWVDAQEKISTSEFALNEFFQKTDWVQGDNRLDVIIPWGKHRADVLREYIDHVEAKCAALAAENAGLKHAMAVTLEHVSVTDTGQSGVAAMIINDALHNSETPATDAFLAEVRAQGVEMFAQWCIGERDFTLIDEDMSDAAAYEECVKRAEYFAAQLRQESAQ